MLTLMDLPNGARFDPKQLCVENTRACPTTDLIGQSLQMFYFSASRTEGSKCNDECFHCGSPALQGSAVFKPIGLIAFAYEHLNMHGGRILIAYSTGNFF